MGKKDKLIDRRKQKRLVAMEGAYSILYAYSLTLCPLHDMSMGEIAFNVFHSNPKYIEVA